jgi:hypothetical protein
MRKLGFLLAMGFAAGCAVLACRAPTQGTLAIYTDMPCTPIRVDGARNALTDFRIYTAGTREALRVNLANDQFASEGRCSEGKRGRMLGTVALSGKGTVFVAVRAGIWTQGRTATPERDCNRSPAECIVAERGLTYAANENLDVPVALEEQCVRVACSDGKTCVQGQCVEIPVYSASSPAPAPPLEQPPLQELDAGIVDASDARIDGIDASSDASVDAGPTLPRWYAVCNNGVASLEERPQQDSGASAEPTCSSSFGRVVCGRSSDAGYDVCFGKVNATSIYSVCCSVAVARCCMVPSSLPGAPGIPLLVTGPEPVGAICSRGGEMGVPKSPCFAPGECASGSCMMLSAADGTALGYGQCL